MRILIAGGLGFLGGRLASCLHKAGHSIVIGSRHPDRVPLWLPHLEISTLNWQSIDALETSCHDIDIIIHASGMNSKECASDPISALLVNGVDTARLVKAASRTNVKKFIYLSTAHVYSSPLDGVITEQTCLKNIHPYATSHLAGEQSVLLANQNQLLEGVVFRLSNAFGAPVHKDTNCWMLLINDLCKQAIESKTLTLNNSPNQKRDYIPVTELCHITELFCKFDRKKPLTGVFNIGTGVTRTSLSIAEIIQKQCEKNLNYKPAIKWKKDTSETDICDEFSFEAKRLREEGIQCSDKYLVTEIDQLLEFCKETFDSAKV